MLLKSRAQGQCMLARVIRSWLSSSGAIFHKSPIASVRGALHVQVGSVRANWPYLVQLWNQPCNHWLVSTCNARTLRKGLTAGIEWRSWCLWNWGYVGVAIYFLDSKLLTYLASRAWMHLGLYHSGRVEHANAWNSMCKIHLPWMTCTQIFPEDQPPAYSGLEQCLKSHSYRIININLHLKTTVCSMLRFIVTTICMGILNVPIDVNASI